MRFASTIVVFSLGLGGCDNGKMHLHPPDSSRDAYVAPWWTPEAGEAKNWDIQVSPPYDVTANRAMYILDLWAVATATTISYDDGSSVTVPAGPLAGKVAELQGRGAKVICRVGTGAIRLTDPDAAKFPGATGTPPDSPTPPAAGSVIGWSTGRDPMERYLDIRAASRSLWEANMWKRFDLAKQLGCDGILHDWSDVISGQSGFTVEVSDQQSFGNALAKQDHDRELSAGMHNGTTNPLVDPFAAQFDFLFLERCGEYGDCGLSRPFLNLRKAVFAVDYTTDDQGDSQSTSLVCTQQQSGMIDDGIVKDAILSSAVRTQCVP
jgi:hypothetical protein